MTSPHLKALPSPGACTAGWRRAIENPATEFKLGYGNYQTGARFRCSALRALDNRINTRGGLTIPELTPNRICNLRNKAVKAGKLVLECRNCCNTLTTYRDRDSRFCCGECRQEYY